jgi:hypothetical protein
MICAHVLGRTPGIGAHRHHLEQHGQPSPVQRPLIRCTLLALREKVPPSVTPGGLAQSMDVALRQHQQICAARRWRAYETQTKTQLNTFSSSVFHQYQ